jgi:DNA topoisomerase-3
MRLIIAEKGSVGKALAAVLPGEKIKNGNHIRCGDDVVAWASGHLLELFEPEDYDAGYSKWRLDTLPIIPERWRLKEISRARAKELLRGIGELLKKADSVVNAGDADREGVLLIDEILEHFGWAGPTRRLLINDTNPDAVRKSLKEMKDDAESRGQFLAARARSYSDWLSGINLTRHCTLHAGNAGYDAMFSVGRVQTPTLGLVVKRDKEIENFVSKAYYVLFCTLSLSGNRKIVGRRKPDVMHPEPSMTDLDTPSSPDRFVSKEDCRLLCEKIHGRGEVTGMDKKSHRKAPPLPYNLAKLQMDASGKYDVTDALAHVQRLYEQGYVTYPRSNCPYIPEGHHAQARLVLDAIASACPDLRDLLVGVDAGRKSSAWNDSKVEEHHGIIPTTRVPVEGILSDVERKIYGLIAKRYALQFLPDCEYEETIAAFTAGGEIFEASGRAVLAPGWTRWDKGEEEKDREDGGLPALPSVSVGEAGEAEPSVEEKKTTPPKRFTYGALLGAMNAIHLYVQDPAIRKRLRELDGIGTAATQEGIVAHLFERGYLEKRKKQVVSTPLGRALIELLSAGKGAAFVTPDLTALWEQKMTRIEHGELSLEAFVEEVGKMVGEIVREPLQVPEISGVSRKKRCLTEGCGGYLDRKTGAYGPFFSCPACGRIFRERGGEPAAPALAAASAEAIEADCPLGCGKKARRFVGKYGPFWRCFCSPDVRFKDADGKPAVPEERRPAVSAKCPVKRCKGTAEQIKKKDGGLFWKCRTCRNTFDDKNGNPVLREKRESARKTLEGGG